MSLRSVPAWTGIAIGLLTGALLACGLLLWQERSRTETPALPISHLDTANAVVADHPDPTGVGTEITQAVDDQISDSRDNAIVRATQKASPAVVSINVTQQQTVQRPNMELLERFIPGLVPRETRRSGQNLGSGVIVSASGLILTNAHVVADAVRILVTLTDGRQFEASLLESVEKFDLALLQIYGTNLPVALMAATSDLRIGEWAIAIGSPFGYLLADTQPTVTVGVISAINRDIKSPERSNHFYLGMIQTDAAINSGNSGGPLVNTRGEIIGINTFIFSDRGGSVGIGFAVPIARGRWLINEVSQYGHFRDFYSGLVMRKLWPELIQRWRLADPVGFVIIGIDQDSPAWKAGLRIGDIVREIEGVPLTSRDILIRLHYEVAVGDCQRFVAERNGEEFDGEIVLEEMP